MTFNKKQEREIAAFLGVPSIDRDRLRDSSHDLDGLLDELLDKYKVGFLNPEEIVMNHWVDIFGPQYARYCQLQKIDFCKRLIVSCDHPIVRREILFERKRILKDIKRLPDCAFIRDFILTAG